MNSTLVKNKGYPIVVIAPPNVSYDKLTVTGTLTNSSINMLIEVYDDNGKLINELAAGKRKGINRVPLSIRMKPPKVPTSKSLSFAGFFGPPLPSGNYTVKIVKGDLIEEGKFEPKKNIWCFCCQFRHECGVFKK